LEVFDFTREIPKIVAYDSTKEIFSEEEIIALIFFNLCGLDILILTPTNYNNIEHLIKEESFDIHQLADVQFDLALPDFSKIKVYRENEKRSLFDGIKGLWK
jgi:hypothetical protein